MGSGWDEWETIGTNTGRLRCMEDDWDEYEWRTLGMNGGRWGRLGDNMDEWGTTGQHGGLLGCIVHIVMNGVRLACMRDDWYEWGTTGINWARLL